MNFLKAILSTAVILASSTSFAQSARPIELVVGFQPGGGTDAAARIVAAELFKLTQQKVVVVNKPGASGKIALNYVATAPKDGSVIMLDTGMASSRSIVDPSFGITSDDFEPVTRLATSPLVLIVNRQMNVNSVPDMVAQIRASKKPYFFASLGPGSSLSLLGELLKKRAKLDMTDVAYQGTPAAIIDLKGDRVQLMFTGVPYLSQMPQDTAKALAVTAEERLPHLPDLPTMKELGYGDITYTAWLGILAPKGTPKDVVARLNKALLEITNDPGTRDRLQKTGITVAPLPTKEFAQNLRSNSKYWQWLVSEVGFSPIK